jgi:uncharacterized protein (DUF2267 family)/CBS domain-containing protein
MSANGIGAFDKTVQTGNLWLKDIEAELGCDRHTAWHVLGVVLRALRDRLPADDAAHLAAQLPLVVRGSFYDQYRPSAQPADMRTRFEFVAVVTQGLMDTGPVDPEEAIGAVLKVLESHVGPDEAAKVRHELPEDIRSLWPVADQLADGQIYGDGAMKVAELMSRNVEMTSPDEPLQQVAQRMAADDIGFLPVGDHDRLVGMITDRDIVTRAIAKGLDGQAKVRDAMTPDVKYCFEDDDIDDVVQNMGDLQVRRLPVVNAEKRLVGVVSLADAAIKHDPAAVGLAMSGVVEPGGLHNSTQM